MRKSERWLFLSLSGLINTLFWLVTEEDLKCDLFYLKSKEESFDTEKKLQGCFRDQPDPCWYRQKCRAVLERVFAKAEEEGRALFCQETSRTFEQLNEFLTANGFKPVEIKDKDGKVLPLPPYTTHDARRLIESTNTGVYVIV